MPPIKTPGTIASLFWAPETPDQPTMRASTTFERLHDLYAALRDYVPLLPENDIQPLATVLQSRGAAAEESAALPAVRQTLKAFHGSPHDFEQFSSAKIGTGEGAQAYGHGLYFAENEGVAHGYRDKLGGRSGWSLVVDGEKVGFRDAAVKAFGEGPGHAVADYTEQVHAAGDPTKLTGIKAKLEELGHKVEMREPGALYEVQLHTSPDELLDWDKPLSQQPKKVQEKLQGMLKANPPQPMQSPYAETSILLRKMEDGTITGGEAYQLAAKGMGKPSPMSPAGRPIMIHQPDQASKALHEAGIKGIQYLDQGSRNLPDVTVHGSNERGWNVVQGGFDKVNTEPFPTKQAALDAAEKLYSKTRNYVIFDDTIIEIAKKYGISLPAAASLYKWQQSQKPQKGVE